MAERTVQAQFAGEWGMDPVVDAHAIGWMQLVVAEDLIKSLSRQFEAPGPSPVYGHVVLARAVIESCARAAWLADPSVTVRTRIARAQSERLYSIAEAMKIPGISDTSDARRRILAEADRQKFKRISAKDQSVVSLEERRPGQTKLVRWLFSENGDLGELIYRWWSAIAHSTLYGVNLHFERPTDALDVAGLTTVAIVISSAQVQNVFRGVILAYAHVIALHERLFGWADSESKRAHSAALELVRNG